jgi:hypothetical protein
MKTILRTAHMSMHGPQWFMVYDAVRKNCFSDGEKLSKFEAEGREFAKCLRSLGQFIQKVKGQNNLWQQNAFLTYSWRFLISNKLEQL